MKQDHLKQMYGTMPESFRHRVAFSLERIGTKNMQPRLTARTILIASAILILLTAVACAAFSSQVLEFFGKQYGNDMQAWLEKGDVATANQSFTLDEVKFTLDEVVYRDNGLYGVGTIYPQEGSNVVIIPEDHTPSEPFGYDIYGEGGVPEDAPADALSIADVARKTGSRLLMVRTLPDQIGVDGGMMLSPGSVGYSLVPRRDGSVRYSFELSDAYAIEKGQTYSIQMWASVCEITMDGKMLENTRHVENWTVEIKPTPINEVK